jgi:hypothetical protein
VAGADFGHCRITRLMFASVMGPCVKLPRSILPLGTLLLSVVSLSCHIIRSEEAVSLSLGRSL